MKDLRSHFLKLRVLINIGIVDALRKQYPNHIVTQTPKSTGILKLAKAGQAYAALDTNAEFYVSRTYKLAINNGKGTRRFKYKAEFGRYNYRGNDLYFLVYIAKYWESEYSQVQSYYILYPRSEGDIIDSQS